MTLRCTVYNNIVGLTKRQWDRQWVSN